MNTNEEWQWDCNKRKQSYENQDVKEGIPLVLGCAITMAFIIGIIALMWFVFGIKLEA